MKRKLILFFLLNTAVFFLSSCEAQENKVQPPRLAVKWSILHLFYFYPTVQIAIEHKLFKNASLQYDFGWAVNFKDDDNRGFRGIGELRYYIPSPPKIPFYLAGEFYYSRLNFDRFNVIGHECAMGDCAYYERVTYKVEHSHQGIGIKYGLLLFPNWNRNRSFFFDLNGGVAYRSISYNENRNPLPVNAEFLIDDDKKFFEPDESDRTEFRPVIGVRIGYSFF